MIGWSGFPIEASGNDRPCRFASSGGINLNEIKFIVLISVAFLDRRSK